ncbi:MAG: iron export ABC transporter permease subunit FetB [Leptolyngbya sp. UWPOB_LEPTO1]|uniref:ABC transporter permease n=1 Tax=Leptolyngbya sp. UWPOB_LEPTO1 TaxID=2815653 RepID=UPI001ACB244C|nr:iron export ABC transporter permease subunit FetB [Leptolyngbya sp. UWPOB_LEPTO1]MBN8559508.1 iron export ABC transporter permease subunit FetB [Leptolyngbya sp. UWPOB_LEPTO1]
MNFATQAVWAIGLVGAAFALSSWQKLGLEGSLILAAGRAVIQLAVVGYVLAVIFAPPLSPILILFVLGVLVMISAIVTRNRISQKLPLPGIVGSLLITTLVTVAYVQLIVVQPQVWYEPRFLIALGAIVLSQAMNAAAISGERLFNTLKSNPLEIETRLSLGATPAQAIEPYRKDAIRAGVLPVINAMSIVGLATIPEIVSGQLLGGAEPIQAIAFQIVILFMVLFATLLVTLLVTSGIWRKFFNAQAQLIRW